MNKYSLTLLAIMFSGSAQAQTVQQYALELSQPCTMTVYDQDGQQQIGITEPAGYVAMYQWWQGASADASQGNAMSPPQPSYSTLWPMDDACGHPLNPVIVVNGIPADGSGGVTITISPSESLARDSTLAATQSTAVIAVGLTISSTGTPAVNGTYSLTPAAVSNFASVEDYVLTNGTFPAGTSQVWLLQNGQSVTIPSVAIFKELATAVASYVDEIDLAAASMASGGTPSWPSASVTVP